MMMYWKIVFIVCSLTGNYFLNTCNTNTVKYFPVAHSHYQFYNVLGKCTKHEKPFGGFKLNFLLHFLGLRIHLYSIYI